MLVRAAMAVMVVPVPLVPVDTGVREDTVETVAMRVSEGTVLLAGKEAVAVVVVAEAPAALALWLCIFKESVCFII